MLKEAMNRMRTWNVRTIINRFYIEKKNGKMRPIGAPDLGSKIFCRFLSDMCTCLLEEPRSGLPVTNHAYRPRKGRHTAVMEMLENYITCIITKQRAPKIMEFDFQSYFNNVTWKSVELALDRLSMSRISALVQMYLKNIRTRFRDVYCPEQEMIELGGGPKYDKKTRTYKPVYLRKGMPQGSPVSPILATLACDMTNPPLGLTMYADDGIYIGEDLSAFKE